MSIETASRITKTPGICGGEACVRDHRIPVWILVNYRRLAGGDSDILCAYPSLTPADFEAAWEYYTANTEEIDRAIGENEEGELLQLSRLRELRGFSDKIEPESNWQKLVERGADYLERISQNHEAKVAEKFARLRDEWKAQRGHEPSTMKTVLLPAYQRIIGMGPAVVPLLLRELESNLDNWFWALMAITEDDPVQESFRGDGQAMAQAWLKWAKERGYQW